MCNVLRCASTTTSSHHGRGRSRTAHMGQHMKQNDTDGPHASVFRLGWSFSHACGMPADPKMAQIRLKSHASDSYKFPRALAAPQHTSLFASAMAADYLIIDAG